MSLSKIEFYSNSIKRSFNIQTLEATNACILSKDRILNAQTDINGETTIDVSSFAQLKDKQ